MVAHWARPGVRCVCVDDDFGWLSVAGFSIPVRVPMLNEVLTISEVLPSDREGCVLAFKEIDKLQIDGDLQGEVLYAVSCFRPLVANLRTQSQDIAEHFKKLLDTKAPIERAPLDIPMLDEVGQ